MKLVAVGDISFGDFPFCAGYGVRSRLSGNPLSAVFDEVVDIFQGADIVFGNLETVLSDANLQRDRIESWEMRGDPSHVDILNHAGFDILNMANNHTMQHGKLPFVETFNLLEKNGIQSVGLVQRQSACKPVIVERSGCSTGFLGYAFEADCYGNNELQYAFASEQQIETDVKALAQKVDNVIVSCHWGLEFIDRPSPNTVRLGRKMIDWGANIVLGHHPHVLQGYEHYEGGLILYSMGNFIFDMLWDKRFRISALFVIEMDRKKEIELEIVPVYVTDNYIPEIGNYDFETEFSRLNSKIDLCLRGDVERNTLSYYLEYEKLRKENRIKSYLYFLRNYRKVKPKSRRQIVTRTVMRHLGRA